MAPKGSVLARRSTRKKSLASTEARRRPTTSGKRLGRYAIKHPSKTLSSGHRAVLRQKTYTPPSPTRQPERFRFSRAGREFVIHCIKQVLTTGNLVNKQGPTWRVKETVCSVNPGESFTSLDACAESILSHLEAQYRTEIAFGT